MKPEEKKRDETGTDSGLGSSLGPQPNPEFVAQGMSFEGMLFSSACQFFMHYNLDLKNCQSSENLPNDGFQLVSRKKKKKKPSRNWYF
jgi:hypothetical protein